MTGLSKTLLAAAAAVLISGGAADAGLVLSVARTGTNVNGFDEISVKLTGYSGPDATFAGTDRVNSLTGTFTVSGGGTLSAPGTATSYKANTTNNVGGRNNPPNSYVNFDSILSGDFARSPATATPASLTGTWYTTDPTLYLRPVDTTPLDGFDQTLFAQVYVTPGTGVSFSGQYNSDAVQAAAVTFTSVPEPAAAGWVGLAGVVALARRRPVRGERSCR